MTGSDRKQHFISGKWIKGQGQELVVINPATLESVTTISLATNDEVDAAVQAAKMAHTEFAKTTVAERKALLAAIAVEYDKRRDEISHAIMQELGAPIDLAKGGQSGTAVSHLRNFQIAIDEVQFEETLPNGDTLVRYPIGVAALITPWNWPIHQVCLKVLAAFAAGCSVVLKPSEETPLNAMILADIMHSAGVPDGVFNLVNGDGLGAGVALAQHPDVQMISFTGSTAAGISVAREAAGTVKKVALELGGKSACLIFDDADLDKALTATINKLYSNSGQNCNAPTRLLVQRDAYERACELAASKVNAWQVNDPTKPGPHIGPVANMRQYNHIQKLIQSGIDEGGKLLVGGTGRPDGLDTGAFVKPTLIADVNPEMQIVQQEVFGPVLVMMPFDTEEEAITIANDSKYGLAAYVHSADLDRVSRVSRQLDAGMVFANGGDLGPGSPFGGVKGSGIGKEGGRHGIEEYLEIKILA